MSAAAMARPRIRPASAQDSPALWSMLEPVIRAGETYALPRAMSEADALAWWTGADHEAFVALDADDAVVGTFYLHANQAGGGAHVANAGFVTHGHAAGRGVAAAMCAHALEQARARGFRAMQFNLVVSTNERAVALWRRMGFDIVGTLPGAFAHPRHGDVDAYVMYRRL